MVYLLFDKSMNEYREVKSIDLVRNSTFPSLISTYDVTAGQLNATCCTSEDLVTFVNN